MAELKTQPSKNDVRQFLDSVENPKRRADAFAILEMMETITGEPAVMWGDSIVGFGTYHYRYATGREADWFLVGFSPRKRNTTLYIMAGFDQYDMLMAKLGKHKTGKSCLYINKLEDVDLNTLRELIRTSVEHMRNSNHDYSA